MDIVLIDETLDINQTKNYHISIQAGLNGYSFLILDPLRNKYILLKHIQFPDGMTPVMLEDKIAGIHKNDEFLAREYKSVYFSWQSPKYTLIPGPLFKRDCLRSYFEFNQVLDDLDEINYNALQGIDAYNIFVIPSELSNIIYRSCKNVTFFHHVTPFIEHCLINHGGKDHMATVVANTYGNNIDVAVISGEELLLCNTFPWKEDSDLIYFILYVYDQLKLDTAGVPLFLAGEISRKSTVYDLLKSYIGKIRLEKQSEHFTYSYTFNETDHHRFLNLFNLKLCVS